MPILTPGEIARALATMAATDRVTLRRGCRSRGGQRLRSVLAGLLEM